MTEPGNIALISFGYFDRKLMTLLAEMVEPEIPFPVLIREGMLDISEFYNPKRNQYDGNLLLKELEYRYIGEFYKTIGIFNVDLFIPILTYIFGQAYLNGRCGIVSVHRLRNERYGLIPDEQLLLDRLVKEVIHELGHTLGLIHCIHSECVMRSGTYVEDIDQKTTHFCEKCRNFLNIDH